MSEGRGKLIAEQVLEIVELLKQEVPHQKIANKYQIARTAITRIANGTRWTNVTGGPVIPVIYENGKHKFTKTHLKRAGRKTKGLTERVI